MLQQVHAVVVAVIALHQKLVRDFHRLVAARHRILVDVFRIGYPHLRIEQAAHVGGIHSRGYPTLPEVEVQVLEGDLFGHGIFQGFKRLFRLRQHFVSLMTIHPIFHVGDFLHHVSGDEAVGNLITILQRIVEHSSFQGFEYLRLRQITKRLHVGQVHAAVPVQRGGQGFFGRLHSDKRFLREGNGMVEDVRLDELPVLAALQREHVAPRSVHEDELRIVSGIEVAVAHDKLVIVGVQVAAQQGVLLVVFRFMGVEPLVGVAQVDVELCLLRLHPLYVERLESCPVLGDILQHPDLETDAAGMFPYHRTFLQVRLHNALERTGHHRFLLPALPFFRCQGCFLFAHLPFHTLNPSSSLCLKAVLYRIDRMYGLRSDCIRLLGGIGIHLFLSHPAQFGTFLRRERHHHFIEAVDGRVRFPVQTAVNGILRVIVFGWGGSTFGLSVHGYWLFVPAFRHSARPLTDDFLYFPYLFGADGRSRFRASASCRFIFFFRRYPLPVSRHREQ